MSHYHSPEFHQRVIEAAVNGGLISLPECCENDLIDEMIAALTEKKMTLIEISEREVLAKAKAWERWATGDRQLTAPAELALVEAVMLLKERERVAGNLARDDVAKSGNEGILSADLKPIADSILSLRRDAEPHPSILTADDLGLSAQERIGYSAERDPSLADTQEMPAVEPRPGAEPITRPPRKLSRREREIEKRRQSDPLGADRADIDYSSDELPSVR